MVESAMVVVECTGEIVECSVAGDDVVVEVA